MLLMRWFGCVDAADALDWGAFWALRRFSMGEDGPKPGGVCTLKRRRIFTGTTCRGLLCRTCLVNMQLSS